MNILLFEKYEEYILNKINQKKIFNKNNHYKIEYQIKITILYNCISNIFMQKIYIQYALKKNYEFVYRKKLNIKY